MQESQYKVGKPYPAPATEVPTDKASMAEATGPSLISIDTLSPTESNGFDKMVVPIAAKDEQMVAA